MILVTGGTGVIGSELLRLLSQAGIPAPALVRNPDKAQKLTRHMQAVLKAQINKTDRNDARGIAQMIRVGL